jgi:hypothetical protein
MSRKWIRGAGALLFAGLMLAGSQPAGAQRRERGTIPENTVVRLKTATPLNSATARQGDRFTATLSDTDRSGFPDGARFVGVVSEVRRHSGRQPGTLNVELRRVILPDNTRVALTGRLTSLSAENIRRMDDGRFENNQRGDGAPNWNWAGYGTDPGPYRRSARKSQNGLPGQLFDFLGGNRGANDRFHEVALPAGTEFGMRLDQQVVFEDRRTYRYFGRGNRRDDNRRDDNRGDGNRGDEGRRGDRQDDYRDAAVRVDGRIVEMTSRPRRVNGVLFVPLQAVARAANMGFTQRAGQESFTLTTDAGRTEATAGQVRVNRTGRAPITLTEAPLLSDGVIYVSADYLERVADLRVDWNPAQMRLDLQSRR